MKRTLLAGIVLLGVLVVAATGGRSAPETRDKIETLKERIMSGGPPPDGIPPIEKPGYVSVAEADDWLTDRDAVFVAALDGGVRVYPQMIMVWHEIVNETLGGRPASVTYCPLTGSAIGYVGDVGDGYATFGTSGKLLNSNLVMYDRKTESLWSQVLGMALDGPNAGHTLGTFPVVWSRWADAKAAYPEARVLSIDTGFNRNYGEDPYGSYVFSGNYYDSGSPMFPLVHTSDALPAKTVVMGLRSGKEAVAVPKQLVARRGMVSVIVGGQEVILVQDPALGGIVAFQGHLDGEKLDISMADGIIRSADGTEWDSFGRGTSGPRADARLVHVDAFEVMWFAWYAFYPDTRLLMD